MSRVGVHTTARVCRGRIERLERHAGRLARDAERLGLPRPDRLAIEARALETVRDRLGRDSGVLRIEWSRPGLPNDGTAASRARAASESASTFALYATIRPLGPEPRTWRAATAKTRHPGPGSLRNAKAIDVPAWEAARAERDAAAVDEVLLYDGEGRLVEGSRTNLIVVARDGRVLTPALGLGPVEGLGLELVRGFLGRDVLFESHAIDRETATKASELIAVNVVRGAAAIVALDEGPIGDGREGPVALRLRSLFFRD